MQKDVTKEMYYTALIYEQIMELFKDEECIRHIDLLELNEDNNATCFIHSLTCAATIVYNRLTGKSVDFLEFNHIANRLCFQFNIKKDTDENN